MATCKDCLIYEKCSYDACAQTFSEGGADSALIVLANQISCKYFKNKADVVEVVRCRDCKHFTAGMAVGMCKRVKDKPIIPVTYNHFCSYGERSCE